MLDRWFWSRPNVIFRVICLGSLYVDFTHWKHILQVFTEFRRRHINNSLHLWVIARLHRRILNDLFDWVGFFYHASRALNVYLGNYKLKYGRTVHWRSTKFNPWSSPLRWFIAIILKIFREIFVGKLNAQKSFVWVQDIVNFNADVSLWIDNNLEKLLWKEGGHLLLVACQRQIQIFRLNRFKLYCLLVYFVVSLISQTLW